jgi:hypothetical protein
VFELLANSKAASSFFGGLGGALGGDPGPVVSGGTVDARGYMDSSGWVVSTGSSKATGGDRDQQGPGFGPATMTPDQSAPALAGFGGLGGLVLLLVVGGMILQKAKP